MAGRPSSMKFEKSVDGESEHRAEGDAGVDPDGTVETELVAVRGKRVSPSNESERGRRGDEQGGVSEDLEHGR